MIRLEFWIRRAVSKRDEVRNTLRHLYMECAGEVQEDQIDKSTKVIHITGDKDYIKRGKL